MLEQLHIENIAVIRKLDLSFTEGFTVLSGETGSGKSVILDSIRLILGERGDKELVRHGEDTAYVSALFSELSRDTLSVLSELSLSSDEDGAVFIERTLTKEGKSQAKWNGRALPLSLLRQATETLLNIHGQNTTSFLMREDAQRAALDRYAGCDDALSAYMPIYASYTALLSEEKACMTLEAERARMTDILKYQIVDIETVSPKLGEEERLQEKRLRLRNREKITKQASFVYRALRGAEKGSVHDLLCRSLRSLSQLSEYLPESEELSRMLEEAVSATDDVAERIYPYSDDDGENPVALLDKIEGRLEEYSRLHRKYGERVEDILAFYEEKKEELSRYESAADTLNGLKKKKKALILQLKSAAEDIRAKRRRAARLLEKELTEQLVDLDMPKVTFQIAVEDLGDSGFRTDGCDRIAFLVAANPGEIPAPLSDVASGGELSRIMLALKSALASKDAIGSLIYDEIDTGVSGKTARKIGLRLASSAKELQILSITHSAQIASLADTHYLISKHEVNGRAETVAKSLNPDERIEELSRIIGGLTVTDVQRKAAKELLENRGEI